jgi:hypothetical protein
LQVDSSKNAVERRLRRRGDRDRAFAGIIKGVLAGSLLLRLPDQA